MSPTKIFIFLVAFVLITVFSYAIIIISISWPISEYSINKAGVFGDSFGILTSIFSGLAFAGLIYTILLQKKELELQREELKLQRQEIKENRIELARTAEAQEKSEEWFSVQSRMMAISAMSNLMELKGKYEAAPNRKFIDELYKELEDLIYRERN